MVTEIENLLRTMNYLKIFIKTAFRSNTKMVVLQCICITIRFQVINGISVLFLEWFYIRLNNINKNMTDPMILAQINWYDLRECKLFNT